jgi:hypothetical protein
MHCFSFLQRTGMGPMAKLRPSRKSEAFQSLAVAIAASLSGLALSAHASIITYAPPTLIGTQVTYPSVSESSNTNTLPLYGAPVVSGNNLVFSNLNFSAVSTNGSPALDYVDGQINFTLQADQGTFLQALNLTEFGDYNISTTPANPAAVDFVEAYQNPVLITVLAINGVAVTPEENSSDTMTITDGGVFETPPNPPPTPQSISGSWNGSVTANLDALFGSDEITEISVSFDNDLLAESQTGGIADIAKKGFDVNPSPVNGIPGMPEPSVMGLAAVAMGMGLKRRRGRLATN